MVIWIFNHHAEKPGGSATRHFDLGLEWVKRGHRVYIFASSFSHNNFKYNTNYNFFFSFLKKENHDGVNFFLFKTFPYFKNDWRRLLGMLSYFLLVVPYAVFIKPRPDVIIGSNVHPLAVAAAWFVSVFKRSVFVFEVRDLWPETLIDTGALRRDSFIARLMRFGERFFYKKAKKIITLMPLAKNYIISLGIEENKIAWVPNGCRIERYKYVETPILKSSPPFNLYYLGSLGKVNGIREMIRAFAILNKSYPGYFNFHIYGSGPEEEELRTLCHEIQASNVHFHGFVSKEKIYEIINKADAFVYYLYDMPLYKYGISPNKLNDYLASGRPVVAAAKVPMNPIAEAGAGICREEISPESLALAVEDLFLHHSSEDRIQMGINGRKYLEKNLDIRILAEKFEIVLKEIV